MNLKIPAEFYRIGVAITVGFVGIIVAGCGTVKTCPTASDSASSGGKPTRIFQCPPLKSATGKDSACTNFYRLDDPFKKADATVEQKLTYAKAGYQCALNRGIVPISPRFNLPALDCPWIREVDATPENVPTEANVYVIGVTNGNNAIAAIAPSIFSEPTPDKFPERGYLLTAFDTPRGVRYVIIESEREFNADARLTDVEKDFGSLVETLRSLDGKVVVYLTSYPLISTSTTETPRFLQDLEITGVKRALQNRADDISFVNWQ